MSKYHYRVVLSPDFSRCFSSLRAAKSFAIDYLGFCPFPVIVPRLHGKDFYDFYYAFERDNNWHEYTTLI